ncbi:unnamed protein product [Trichobilharzia szidati]|nr:unnamed protein product [Trichobilharzia szidati]
MLVQNDTMKHNIIKDGESQPIQASVEIKHYPKERSARSTKRSNPIRSTERGRQKSLNIMLCGCLVPGTECTSNIEHPPIDNNRRLLPTSAIQSMESLSISRKTGSNHSVQPSDTSENSSVVRLQPVVNLPSCALITDALLSQTKRVGMTTETIPSNGTKRQGWRSFRFSRRKETSVGKTKHYDPVLGTTVTRPVKSSASHSETEKNSDVDQSHVFSPLPSQALPETVNTDEHQTALLGPKSEADKSKKCFVIDLDETLVHSSFKVIEHADFKVGVEIDGVTHRVYVLKRPHVDLFLSTMANLYECVLFTASLAKYADPVADFIDKWHAFRYRLFRESCVYHRGNYVKDLSHLGRPINQVVILDNSPASYMFHASHAVQISSWFDDANDRVLLDLIPYFEKLATQPNVVDFLKNNVPPTPFAAVGTVGLPASLFPHAAFPVSGKSTTDGNSIISSIKRPAVASPFPVSSADNRSQNQNQMSSTNIITNAPATTTTTTCTTVSTPIESKTIGSTNSDALPVITKLIPSSSGPTLTPVAKKQDVSTFPAPLSLAAYVPITSPSCLNAVASTKVYPISSSVQTFIPVTNTNLSNSLLSNETVPPSSSPSPPPQISEKVSGISSLSPTNQSCHIPAVVKSTEQNSAVVNKQKIALNSYHQKKPPVHTNKRLVNVSNYFKSNPHTTHTNTTTTTTAAATITTTTTVIGENHNRRSLSADKKK